MESETGYTGIVCDDIVDKSTFVDDGVTYMTMDEVKTLRYDPSIVTKAQAYYNKIDKRHKNNKAAKASRAKNRAIKKSKKGKN